VITTTHYGERSVHDQAAARLHEWYNDFMQKSQQADVVKVGPKGYAHGWIKVGTGDDEHLASHDHVLTSSSGKKITGEPDSKWHAVDENGNHVVDASKAVAAYNDSTSLKNPAGHHAVHDLKTGKKLGTFVNYGKQGFVSYPSGKYSDEHLTQADALKRVVNGKKAAKPPKFIENRNPMFD
jgi:hypothetical protein